MALILDDSELTWNGSMQILVVGSGAADTATPVYTDVMIFFFPKYLKVMKVWGFFLASFSDTLGHAQVVF